MPEYIDRLIEVLEVRNEVMAELEEDLEGLPLDVTREHDEHFGDGVTNKIVVAAMELEVDRRLAERERDRRRASLS